MLLVAAGMTAIMNDDWQVNFIQPIVSNIFSRKRDGQWLSSTSLIGILKVPLSTSHKVYKNIYGQTYS
jgi:hypothetical protein